MLRSLILRPAVALRPRTLAALGLAALLAGCVPSGNDPKPPPPPPVSSGVVGAQTSFFPSSAGLSWAYIKEDASSAAPKFKLEILGPSLFMGKVLTAMRFSGSAADQTYFREFSASGVKLHGISLPQTGDVVFDPPIQEYPAPEAIRVGASWRGDTVVAEPNINDPAKPRRSRLSYTYSVLAREQFFIEKQTYDTFRIAVERVFPDSNQRTTQTIRFTPNVGEVRTQEGLLLVGKNF